jgi:pimeloyl-ACP methyl ester carboxylesterase
MAARTVQIRAANGDSEFAPILFDRLCAMSAINRCQETINAEGMAMKMDSLNFRQMTYRAPVIALHCSGAGASEWYSLAEALGEDYEVRAPEHYGGGTSGAWTGEHAFTLADDAARAIALIDAIQSKVHLVGHSYGGGVALHVALARPSQIASMVLYEPSAFHLLRQLGEPGAQAFSEIAGVARQVADGVLTGDYRRAVAGFVDYWSGTDTWERMRPAAQRALICWAPKGPLDFHALIENSTPASAYRTLKCPVLIMRGEHALKPSRIIADQLAELLPDSRLLVIEGAGHMGPFTQASKVAALIAHHITTIDAQSWEAKSRSAAPPMEAMS